MAHDLYPDRWWRRAGSGVDKALWPYYESFAAFLALVWAHLNLPAPTWLQKDLALFLQNGPRRRVIEAFRGVGKSWITSAYVVWRLLRNPAMNILVVSASKQRADDFTTFTMRLIHELPILQHLRPKEGQRNSKIAFDVAPAPPSHAPSVKSVGITGQLTGSRADLIVSDDVEVPNNSATQVMRDKLSEQIKEYDAILKPGGEVLYLGTPQTEQSIYNSLPERGYTVCIWPARFPDEKQRAKYGDKLAGSIARLLDDGKVRPGQPTDPKRFTETDLLEREASYGRAGFALQFMLDTSLADADRYPLKLSDFLVMSVPQERAPIRLEWGSGPDQVLSNLPNVGMNGDRWHRPIWTAPPEEWAPFTGCVMAIDPSGRGKDETGYAVVKMCHGLLYLVAAGGFLGGYSEETLQALAMTAARHGVNKVIVEPNFGDGMFRQLLAPVLQKVHPCTLEDAERSQAQKEKRIIDTLEPVLMRHRLVVDPRVIEADYRSTEGRPVDDAIRYRLFYQLTRITRDKGALTRDDRLDALAMAVGYWVEQMNQDLHRAQQSHLESLRDAELQRFMEHAIGYKPQTPSWGRVLQRDWRGN